MKRRATTQGKIRRGLIVCTKATVEAVCLERMPFPWRAKVRYSIDGKTQTAYVRIPMRRRRVRMGGVCIAHVRACRVAGLKCGSEVGIIACRLLPGKAVLDPTGEGEARA